MNAYGNANGLARTCRAPSARASSAAAPHSLAPSGSPGCSDAWCLRPPAPARRPPRARAAAHAPIHVGLRHERLPARPAAVRPQRVARRRRRGRGRGDAAGAGRVERERAAESFQRRNRRRRSSSSSSSRRRLRRRTRSAVRAAAAKPPLAREGRGARSGRFKRRGGHHSTRSRDHHSSGHCRAHSFLCYKYVWYLVFGISLGQGG